MKKLSYIALLLVTGLFTGCDTNDDTFYKTIYVEGNNTIVTFSPQTTYTVGDYFYVNADINRYIDEPGHPGSQLDVYRTTGNAPEFVFSYVIERKINATDWQVVTVNDNQLDINQGDAQNGAFVYGVCEYNTVTEEYRYDVGFPLLTAGNYRVAFGYNSASTNSVELVSQNSTKNLIVNLNAAVANLDASGFFYFNVN
ncbi:hypothetical protein [Flavobacterium terrisoli]|uniref:hypothetical protein n=1 Tax=Flavobacterium terrisoli TaxID=3242195 RepID=UPI002543731F|nr:hypothetical protein [Flavobacterium buctense]